jgi:hypothetical protein
MADQRGHDDLTGHHRVHQRLTGEQQPDVAIHRFFMYISKRYTSGVAPIFVTSNSTGAKAGAAQPPVLKQAAGHRKSPQPLPVQHGRPARS